ncbi:MAG: efflux RND transporter periplasmic adaptor subunit [Pseudomonadota bacterium]
MHKNLMALMSATLLVSACERAATVEEPIRAVKVVSVDVGQLSSGYEFAGEVRAREESRLGFRVGGKVIRRQAEVGQRVKPGQILAQLDPQDLRLAAEGANSQLSAAATQRDLAAAELKRYQELKAQNFISGAELERREATFKSAEAQYAQARSQLAVQGNQVGYASLAANVAGVVTAVDAEPGQVVSAGTPVVRIAADGPRDVVFALPEDRVGAIKVGLPVKVRAWGQGAVTMAGKVREVGASADPATRTFAVKVAIDAGAASPPLGATSYVSFDGVGIGGQQGTPAIKLPSSALRQEGKGSAVWVLDQASMTVRSQPVVVATADGNEAVIASGLQPGMLVVSAGVHVLSPGQKVTIYRPAVMAASPAASAVSK